MQKVALVTGSSSGIGFETSLALARDGYHTFASMRDIKKGEKIAWPGFGSFSMSERGPRTGRNPQTGEAIKIKKSRSIKLSTSAPMKQWLLGKAGKR